MENSIGVPPVSADAVEEAKEFAANTVRPSTPEEIIAEHAEQRAVAAETAGEATDEGDAFPVVNLLESETLQKIADSPEIAAALAAEGLEINQDEITRALEENQKRTELEVVLAPNASVGDLNKVFTADEIREENLEPVTPEGMRDLKQGINSSFEEVASLLLEHQRQIDDIEARLAEHNKRGGHKI